MCIVEGREVGGGGVVVVRAIAEDLQEGEVGGIVSGRGQGLDLRCGEEFGEDESVRGRCCSCYQICGGAG